MFSTLTNVIQSSTSDSASGGSVNLPKAYLGCRRSGRTVHAELVLPDPANQLRLPTEPSNRRPSSRMSCLIVSHVKETRSSNGATTIADMITFRHV